MKALVTFDAAFLLALSVQDVWRGVLYGWWERELIILYGTTALLVLFRLSFAVQRVRPAGSKAMRVIVLVSAILLLAAAQVPQNV